MNQIKVLTIVKNVAEYQSKQNVDVEKNMTPEIWRNTKEKEY